MLSDRILNAKGATEQAAAGRHCTNGSEWKGLAHVLEPASFKAMGPYPVSPRDGSNLRRGKTGNR